MTTGFDILAATGPYSVAIERGAFTRLSDDLRERVIIIDDFFLGRMGDADKYSIAVTANEASKSLQAIPQIIEQMHLIGVNRKTMMLAVGGGAVQDIAGFVASIYMRGVPWIYMPTTLLGMVDSCIGGKSSINVGIYKNIVGTFYPPKSIHIDPDLCETLNTEMRVAGLCEAAKICFARGPEAFDAYNALKLSVDSGTECLSKAIDLSLRSKKWFIERDEFDHSERLLLNFGHTFGHAMESASRFELSHGVAVGLGILVAIEVAAARSMGVSPDTIRLRRHIEHLLGQIEGLTSTVSKLTHDDLWTAFCSDKKHDLGNFCVVLPSDGSGQLRRVFIPKEESVRPAIISAFDKACAAILKSVG